MFSIKKRKIEKYLADKKAEERTAFDEMLSDYLSGELKRKLESFGMRKVDIHIDWLPKYKCMGAQGKAGGFWNIQIDPTEFLISFDKDEPDDDNFYPLESKAKTYEIIERMVRR